MRVGEFVDRAPVPAPIQKDRSVGARLHVVLCAQYDFERERAVFSERGGQQREIPQEKDGADAEERPQQPGVARNRRVQSKRGETGSRQKRQGNRLRRREHQGAGVLRRVDGR